MASLSEAATWSTRQIPQARQFSRWRDAVCDTHLAWDMPNRREAVFDASVRHQNISTARLIECICDPCAGQRREREIGRANDAYFGVLHLLSGREMVRQGGREVLLESGDFLLWDSTRPIEFAITGKLHKLTLLVPQRLLSAVLPDAERRAACTVSGTRGCGALFTNHLRALAREGSQLALPNQPALLEATLDLLAAALDERAQGTEASRQQAMLARVQGYIMARLGDPALTPDAIAAAHGISLRQLHRLFEPADATLERWIWRERLARCRHELALLGTSSISQIAFKWGFSDAAHFSRAFREQFGVSPRELRKQSKNP